MSKGELGLIVLAGDAGDHEVNFGVAVDLLEIEFASGAQVAQGGGGIGVAQPSEASELKVEFTPRIDRGDGDDKLLDESRAGGGIGRWGFEEFEDGELYGGVTGEGMSWEAGDKVVVIGAGGGQIGRFEVSVIKTGAQVTGEHRLIDGQVRGGDGRLAQSQGSAQIGDGAGLFEEQGRGKGEARALVVSRGEFQSLFKGLHGGRGVEGEAGLPRILGVERRIKQ